eukprot:s5505_g4.t2
MMPGGELLMQVAKLALRHEQQLHTIQQDTRLYMFLKTNQDYSVLPLMLQLATEWRTTMEQTPEKLTMSLREVMIRGLLKEWRTRLQAFQNNEEARTTAQRMQWLDSLGHWNHMHWCPTKQDLVLTEKTESQSVNHRGSDDQDRRAGDTHHGRLYQELQVHSPASGVLPDGLPTSHLATCYTEQPAFTQQSPLQVRPTEVVLATERNTLLHTTLDTEGDMKQSGFGALNTTLVHGTQSAPATVLALAESRNNLTLNATLNVSLGSDSQSGMWWHCVGGQVHRHGRCESLLVGATVALHQHNHNRFVNMWGSDLVWSPHRNWDHLPGGWTSTFFRVHRKGYECQTHRRRMRHPCHVKVGFHNPRENRWIRLRNNHDMDGAPWFHGWESFNVVDAGGGKARKQKGATSSTKPRLDTPVLPSTKQEPWVQLFPCS